MDAGIFRIDVVERRLSMHVVARRSPNECAGAHREAMRHRSANLTVSAARAERSPVRSRSGFDSRIGSDNGSNEQSSGAEPGARHAHRSPHALSFARAHEPKATHIAGDGPHVAHVAHQALNDGKSRTIRVRISCAARGSARSL
ncbi:hypothetical protein [Burkholderia oklahomensis]|uniref:hypothetical protein n=1 Tax=Burkholderia oklahomensis TaxID=342113 RepID=UPI001E2B63A1|nr:hypothetical protein [Burkholderia oklahomensis]